MAPQCHDFSQRRLPVTTAIGKAEMKHAAAIQTDSRHNFN